MNGVNYEENSRSFARSLSRLASKGGRAMKRGVSREFDRETMRTNLKLFIAMGLTWIAGIYLLNFTLFLSSLDHFRYLWKICEVASPPSY